MKHLTLAAMFLAAVVLGLMGSAEVRAGEDPTVEFSPRYLEILDGSFATVTVLIAKDLTEDEIDAREVIVELVDTSPNLGDKTLLTQKPEVPEEKEEGDEFVVTLTFTVRCEDGKIVGSDLGEIDLSIELEGGFSNYGLVRAICKDKAAVFFDPDPVEIPIGGEAKVTAYIKKRVTVTEANEKKIHARLVDEDDLPDADDDLAEKEDIKNNKATNKIANVKVTFTLECPKSDVVGDLGSSGETEAELGLEFPPAFKNHGKGIAKCVEADEVEVSSTGVNPADVVVDEEKKLVLLLNAGGPGVDVFTAAGTYISTIGVPCEAEPASLNSGRIDSGAAQPAAFHPCQQGMVLFGSGLAWLGVLDYNRALLYYFLLALTLPGDANGTDPAVSSPLGGDVDSVPVGDKPVAAAYDPVTGQVYVANRGSANVTVIDAETKSVVETIHLGGTPNGIAINSEAGRAYVSHESNSLLTVIDTATNAVLNNIGVGALPYGVAVDPETGRVYVANFADGTVSVIDGGLAGSVDPVIDTITVGAGPIDVAVNPRTGHLFVANAVDDTVSVIDKNTNEVIRTVDVGDSPDAVAVNADAGLVYVANHGDNTMSILEDAPQPLSMLWTDVDCNGETDAVDALTLLRDLAGLPVSQTQPCFEIGGDIDVTQFNKTTERRWGDANCSGGVDAVDALQKLRQLAGLSVSQVEPCPPIGSIVGVVAS